MIKQKAIVITLNANQKKFYHVKDYLDRRNANNIFIINTSGSTVVIKLNDSDDNRLVVIDGLSIGRFATQFSFFTVQEMSGNNITADYVNNKLLIAYIW